MKAKAMPAHGARCALYQCIIRSTNQHGCGHILYLHHHGAFKMELFVELDRRHLDEAARQGLITEHQAGQLWAFLKTHSNEAPGFKTTHVLYYLGGLIALSAMVLLLDLSHEVFGGWGLFTLAVMYMLAGLGLTRHFLYKNALRIPAGISATFVVAMTPVAVYGLQTAIGWWENGLPLPPRFVVHDDTRWVPAELLTMLCALVMLRSFRLPFLVMPAAVAFWIMSVDLAPFFYANTVSGWQEQALVSIVSGLIMILSAFWIDLKTRPEHDYAFWLYVLGVAAFWLGLTLLDPETELGRFLYLCANLLLLMTGTLVTRRVFAVFGGLGIAAYLSHLAYTVFSDSVLFPVALTFIGLGIVYLGILWQKNETRINAFVTRHVFRS